jgi:hypothetical protein
MAVDHTGSQGSLSALPIPDLGSVDLIALDRQCSNTFAHLAPGTFIAGVVGTYNPSVPSFHRHTPRKKATLLTAKQHTPSSISTPPIAAHTVGSGTPKPPNPTAAYNWRRLGLPITSPKPPCPISMLAIMAWSAH